MNRQVRPSFKPCLETLEERCTPSGSHAALENFQSPGTAAVIAASQLHIPPQAENTFVMHAGHEVHAIWPLHGRHGDFRIVPFKVTGGGPAPDGLPLVPGETAPHYATGTATHLGHYTGAGTFQLDSLQISSTGQVTGTFHGTFVFVAANGDKLAFNYAGNVTGQLSADGTSVNNVKFVGLFTPDPTHSTGRFADVVGGSIKMVANADSISLISTVPGYSAPFNYTWSGEGTLEFSK